MLDGLVDWAPAPQGRETDVRKVEPAEDAFSGFVFKIQANMDPQHRDRVAFLRIVSGRYNQGMKARHVRIGKEVRFSDALTFMAGDRDMPRRHTLAILSVCTTTVRSSWAIPLPPAMT